MMLDVIVIGAWWAGLGAAQTLYNKGVTNFVVLEGRDRIGGRSHTAQFENTDIELGSQWIHGASTENPVYKVACKAGIDIWDDPSRMGVWSDVFGGSTPHRVAHSDIERLRKSQWYDGFFPFQRKMQKSTNVDRCLRSTVDKYIHNHQVTGQSRLGLEFLLETLVAQEYAASLEDLSTWWWNCDQNIDGGDALLLSPGYSGAIQCLAEPFHAKIRLNSKVIHIKWSDSNVVVVKFIEDGVERELRACKCIVTVPLGVLQRGCIHFKPRLPRRKQLAIDRLGNGVSDKVILKWDEDASLPWPRDTEWLAKIANLGQQEVWTEFYNLQPATGQNTIIAFSAGREAVRVEGLSDDAILSEIMSSLKSMYGDCIPLPKNVLVTRWGADPFCFGSYSFYKQGSGPKDRECLRAPLGDRLFFAGEACHLEYAATTHGAMLSGQRAGAQATKVLRRKQTRKNNGRQQGGYKHN